MERALPRPGSKPEERGGVGERLLKTSPSRRLRADVLGNSPSQREVNVFEKQTLSAGSGYIF